MANFTATAGADSLIGTDTEADVFRVTPLTLQPADTISGGAGALQDTLRFTAAGAVAAAALAGVSGIERIDLYDGGTSIVLPAALVLSAGGPLSVNGGAAADLIDGSLLLDPALRLVVATGSGGADTVIGGAGADSVTLQGTSTGRSVTLGGGDDTVSAAIAALGATDIVQGGVGRDRLALASAGAWQAAALVGLGSIEEIALPNIAGTTLQVSDAMANQADGDVLTIIGNGQDQTVDASGVLSPRAISFLAGGGTDSVLGGAGADTVESSGTLLGTLGAGQDMLRLLSAATAASSTISGGAGNDTILVTKKGDWVLGAGLTGFETVELLAARIRLTLNATEGLEVLGSAGADTVVLGGARQAFYGFEGDDTVTLTAAMLPGVTLHGGTQIGRDTVIITGGGTMDLRRAFITGFERLEVETGGVESSLFLSNQPMDVLLRGAATVYFGSLTGQSVFGSNGGETFYLGAAGQVLLARGGSDFIQARVGDLVAGTMIDGGNDFDLLDIIGGGTVNLRSGALVQNVERIALNDSTTLILDAAPGLDIQGSGTNDTIEALLGDITGDLGSGSDLLTLPLNQLAARPGAQAFSGGVGVDTLRIVAGGPNFQDVTIPTRFTNFEVLDLGSVGAGQTLRIQDSVARTILYGAAQGVAVYGGAGNESFQLGAGGGGAAFGQAGNDILLGGAGDERLEGGAGNDSISGGGGFDQITGGMGRDTLKGGADVDWFYIDDSAELADWAVNPRTIIGSDGGPSNDVDELIILASGTGSIDFTAHSISYIDRIRIGGGLTLTMVLSDAMVATADAGGFGSVGRLVLDSYVSATDSLVINAGALTAGHAISTIGAFYSNDSMQGGAGNDNLAGVGGNDTLKGGGDNDILAGGDGSDELRGEAGNDSIQGGAGADSIWGDDGGDLIQLGASDLLSDRIAYNSPTNGSADINTTVAVGTADLIQNFTPRASAVDTVGDWIAVSVAGLGLNGGANEKVLANGETWDAAAFSVFVVHSLDTLGNGPAGADFGSFQAVADGVNVDAGTKSGFIPGRTVLFALSNGEGVATRQTGLYRWSDNGNGLLESADDLRLLAVIDGVSTASFSTETIVLA